MFQANELSVKWCKTCLKVCILSSRWRGRATNEEFLELVGHTGVQLLPRARVRQKVKGAPSTPLALRDVLTFWKARRLTIDRG
ncbi:hypothetical protein ACS0PU_011859 [Formica fusca]